MSFELYDLLLQRSRERDEKNIDIDKMCSTINSIALLDDKSSKEHYDELQVLLLHHESLKNNKVLLTKIPYNGIEQQGGRGVKYIFRQLQDPQLQQILYEYILYYSQ